MSEAIRSKVETVKKWEEEGGKIYLLTQSGEKYRYVGRYDVCQISQIFPENMAIMVRPVFAGNRTILFDHSISSCWENQKGTP